MISQPQPQPQIQSASNEKSSFGQDFTTSSDALIANFAEDLHDPVLFERFQRAAMKGLSGFPAKTRQMFQAIFQGFAEQKKDLVKEGMKKLPELEFVLFPKTREEMVSMGQVLFLCLKIALEKNSEFRPEDTLACLKPFVKYYGEFGHLEGLQEYVRFPLVIAERFFVAYFDAKAMSEITNDDFLKWYFDDVKVFFSSKSFLTWTNSTDGQQILAAHLTRWVQHLANFLQIHREKPFTSLLEMILFLHEQLPDIESSLQSLPLLLPLARTGFLPARDSFQSHVQNLLTEYCLKRNPGENPFLLKLLGAFQSGEPLELADISETDEKIYLTVEYAYKAALEEILGDGNISDEENTIIQSLRDYLAIPVDVFQRIFNQVKERLQKGKGIRLDRDFSAEEFLFKILLKTIQDGKITDSEKDIIKKVCDALMIDREILEKTFQRAKETKQQRSVKYKSSNVPKDTEAFQSLFLQFQREREIQRLFLSEKGKSALGKLVPTFSSYYETCEKSLGKQNARPYIDQYTVAHFFYEPKIFSFPTIGVFLNGDGFEAIRLQLKGNDFEVCFTDDVAGFSGNEKWDTDGKLLSIVNRTLNCPVPIQALVLSPDVSEFLKGLEDTGGEYRLFFSQLDRQIPIKLLKGKGFIDASGKLNKSSVALQEGNFDQALSQLSDLRKSNPRLHNVYYRMGLCYRTMGLKTPDSSKYFESAIKYFQLELGVNPDSELAMSGIGKLYKVKKDYPQALAWYEKAVAVAPHSIPVVTGYVATLLEQDSSPNRKGILPDFVSRYLGEAYHLNPEHPLVVEMISGSGSFFGADVKQVFRRCPVNSAFQ